jgi:hypothetical protein
VGPTQGVQAIANAAPATIGPPLAGSLDQRVGAPFAVQPGHEDRGEEQDPEHHDRDPVSRSA